MPKEGLYKFIAPEMTGLSEKFLVVQFFLFINCIRCYRPAAEFPSSLPTPANEDSIPVGGFINVVTPDPINNNIYVGAVNNIFMLDSDLRQLHRLETGPLWDNDDCVLDPPTDPRFCLSYAGLNITTTDLRNNINLALVVTIDAANIKRLIICGTHRNGLCKYHAVSENRGIQPIPHEPSKARVRLSVSNDTAAFFVGPGPERGKNFLWMGAFKRLNDPDKYDSFLSIMGISARTLHAAEGDFKSEEKVLLSPINNEVALSCLYNVHFIEAFGSGGFSYFLANMPTSFPSKNFFSTNCVSAKTNMASKIIQVCQTDPTLKSYVETSISCSSGRSDWSVLRAAMLITPGETLMKSYKFSKLREKTETDVNPGEEFIAAVFSSASSNSSQAVCFYPVSWIRETMLKNLRRCFTESQGETGVQFPNSVKCKTLHLNVKDSYCRPDGSDPLEGPISGTMGVDATPSFIIDTENDVTAMTSLIVDGHTILFLGTTTGRLMKILLDSFNNTSVNRAYKSTEISPTDNTPVRKNIFLSKDSKFLFATTEQKVYKIPLSECEEFLTCQECLASTDPICGWCALEGRCSMKSSCSFDGFEATWLDSVDSICPVCTSATPYLINLDADVKNISFNVKNLPTAKSLDSSYKCTFDLNSPHNVSIPDVSAIQTAGEVACSVIELKRILDDMSDELQLTVKLSATDRERPFHAVDYLLYRCSSIKNCTVCVGSEPKYLCGWCFSSNKCTKATACPNPSEKRLDSVNWCPRILEENETILAAGYKQTLELKTANLVKEFEGSLLDYFCKLEDVPGEFSATFISKASIKCHINPIAWSEKKPKVLGLKLFWRTPNRNVSSAVESVFYLTVYNCSAMSEGDDCSVCQSLGLNRSTEKFDCKWCGGGCKHSCLRAVAPECPDPRIDRVVPLSGPMQGGTVVTLFGANLGARRNLTKVTIADLECSPVNSEISKRFVCRTEPSPRPVANAVVEIRVAEKLVARSRLSYAYTAPRIDSIRPSFGPAKGRTSITVRGEDLTLDKKHDFEVAVGLPCEVDRTLSNSSTVVCKKKPLMTPASSLPVEIPIRIKIDRADVMNERVKFRLTGDPMITGIRPPSTFESGGCPIRVHGLNLNASSSPSIKILMKSKELSVTPTAFNGTLMEFSFPPCHVGTIILMFVFDDVRLSRPFQVIDDPVISSFSTTVDSKMLELQGENLLRGCDVDRTRVTVGNRDCWIVEASDSSILCRFHQNFSSSDDYEEKLQINVTLGNLLLNPGLVHLSNSKPTVSRMDSVLPIVVGSIVGGLLILVFTGVLILVRKILTSRKRNNILLKRIQVLEKTISVQCKQSFAELQTHVSGFSNEISEAGIPYWDFKTYAFKFLFPMLRDHEVLRTVPPHNPNCNNVRMGRSERLDQLNQLLCNKYFLLTFIRTLESHPKEFGVEDRSRMASWLTIIWMDKLEYLTIVMKELLEELIRKSIERGTQKMMLRRTESVVEKLLSNWLCLTMFHYLKVEVGKCLFRLCKAIEYQVDDGPVDALTLESKFSLAEERLLRVKVDPQMLNVAVTQPGQCGLASCKMFDCDTISQAKCKAIKALYKGRPYSSNPSPDNFELRLKMEGHEHGLILRDEDVSTLRSNDWVQLNTLKHFNIKSGSTFILTIKNKFLVEREGAENMATADSTSGWGTLKHSDMRPETRQFHLVRQDELHTYYDGSEKLMSEVFLPRLLITKKALEDYIRKLFGSMMTCDCNLPPTIKFLFDFFDSTAHKHNIIDVDVVHIWKSNSLPLRFWVSVMRNPDFVFDVEKSPLVDPCLAVVAQVFIDGCSTHKHQLGLDSSSAKLLFANEMQSYKSQVDAFYSSIHRMPSIDWNSMNEFLHGVEREATHKFNTQVALQEVLSYIVRFQSKIREALDRDLTCCNLKLPLKFHQLLS